MKKKNIVIYAIAFFVLITVLVIGGAYYLSRQRIYEKPPELKPETENLVGNDRDEHGCIGSAGYSWCELKQKCLRTWEEACATITVDEKTTLITYIKNALIAKHGADAANLNITVSKIEGNYAQGGASGEGGGGMWFSTKVNGDWQLIWDGNGVILCSDLTAYPKFPATMIPECYNDKTGVSVKR